MLANGVKTTFAIRNTRVARIVDPFAWNRDDDPKFAGKADLQCQHFRYRLLHSVHPHPPLLLFAPHPPLQHHPQYVPHHPDAGGEDGGMVF